MNIVEFLLISDRLTNNITVFKTYIKFNKFSVLWLDTGRTTSLDIEIVTSNRLQFFTYFILM